MWILEADRQAIGLVVLEEGPNHLVVYSIAVLPAWQGRGHAKSLLRFAEQQAAARGLDELRLYTNTRMERNIALYRGCGFVEIGTRAHPSRAGEVLVDMAKRIANPPTSLSRAG